MEWKEAVKLLSGWKKVKSEFMDEGVYLFRHGDKIMHQTCVPGKIEETSVFCGTWWGSKWEEYKEEDDWNILKDFKKGFEMRFVYETDKNYYYPKALEKLKAKIFQDIDKINRDGMGRSTECVKDCVRKIVSKRFGF